MASLDSLSDGQRAVLQLLLRQNKSYDDLANLLKTDLDAVRARARGAVTALGPEPAGIDEDRRDEIADYLLGQQSASRRAATREYLEGSAAGRSWARSVATALSPLANGELPDIPAEREEVAEAFDALDARAARQVEVKKSSQLGSRLIAAGIGVVLAIAIILALSLGGADDPDRRPRRPDVHGDRRRPRRPPATSSRSRPRAPCARRGAARPTPRARSRSSTSPTTTSSASPSRPTGLPPSSTRGSAYGVWLYSSPSQNRFLGFPDTVVGADGKLETVSDLSPDTPPYSEVLLTRETAETPKRPGTIILRGRLSPPRHRPAPARRPCRTPRRRDRAPTTTTP